MEREKPVIQKSTGSVARMNSLRNQELTDYRTQVKELD